jgi:hypothetical protein
MKIESNNSSAKSFGDFLSEEVKAYLENSEANAAEANYATGSWKNCCITVTDLRIFNGHVTVSCTV